MSDSGVITKQPGDGDASSAPTIRLQNRDESCCCSFLDDLCLFMCLCGDTAGGVSDSRGKHKDARRGRTRVGIMSSGWGASDSLYHEPDLYDHGGNGDAFGSSGNDTANDACCDTAVDSSCTTTCDTSCDAGCSGGD